MFKCVDGTCLYRYEVNNHVNDCDSDEGVIDFKCLPDEFHCNLSNQCVPLNCVNNGYPECWEGEDENVIVVKCLKEEFRCDHKCLPAWTKCDGRQNCLDGSDELQPACEDPTMYKCDSLPADRTRVTLMQWSYLLQDDLVNNETLRICGSRLYPLDNALLMGFKCRVRLSTGGSFDTEETQPVSKFRRAVPQFYVKNNISVCANYEDRCYDEHRKCFVCLDGTVIGRDQVCDHVVDCRDLSDECLCESSKTEELCREFFANPTRDFQEAICNGSAELESSDDERFCDWTVIRDARDSYEARLITCSRGKSSRGSMNTRATLCDGRIECPRREDECVDECFAHADFTSAAWQERFYQCFPDFRGCFRQTSTFVYCDSRSSQARWTFPPYAFVQYLESSNAEGPFPFLGVFYTCTAENCSVGPNAAFNRIDQVAIEAEPRPSLPCKNNPSSCPWLFFCDDYNRVGIKISKVCDHHVDCGDGTDEQGCPETTHFYCSGGGSFIKRAKYLDGHVDCPDKSDECFETEFSSPLEMLKNEFLRSFVWFSAVITILANIYVIVKHARKVCNEKDRRSVKFVNRLLLLFLSLADLLMGVALLIVAVKSQMFSGEYCHYDMEWRSGLLCRTVGVLTVLSSETSVNLLVTMTLVRCFTTLNPYLSTDVPIKRLCLALLYCLISSIAFSLFPLFGSDAFKLVWIEPNVHFTRTTIERAQIDNFVRRRRVLVETIPDKVIFDNDTFQSAKEVKDYFKHRFEDQVNKTGTFADSRIEEKGELGYYSSSSVCLPDFYANRSAASHYSTFLIIYNSLALVIIGVGYLLIYRNTRKSQGKFKLTQKQKEQSRKKKRTQKMKITAIIVTDALAWLPIICMSVMAKCGFELPDVVHPISTIVLLPINSLVNPFIYSDLGQSQLAKLRNFLQRKQNKTAKAQYRTTAV